MIPIILEFAFGVAIGSISGLLVLKHSGGKHRTKKYSTHRSRRASGVRRPQKSTELLAIKRAIIAKPQPKIVVAPAAIVAEIQYTTSSSQGPVLSSCPACGLMAPEKLMAEHLLGSPLHRKQSPVAPLTTAQRSTRPRVDVSLQDDSRESMRNLLQMLVPPRAFGRRNTQRTVNPLSQLVQTPE